MLHIVLFEPEMPPNTANIGRTCLATNTKLHIINPQFEIDRNKRLGRPSRNNWEYVNKKVYENLDDFFNQVKPEEFYILTKFGQRNFWELDLNVTNKDIFLILGSESYGLPEEFTNKYLELGFKIPMHKDSKTNALNVSNVAAICMYEAMRQSDFNELI